MKICKKCGAKLPDDSLFCQFCGSAEVEEEIVKPKEIIKEVQPVVKQKYKVPFIVVSIIAVCLIGGLVWSYYQYEGMVEYCNSVLREKNKLKAEVASLKTVNDNWNSLLNHAADERANGSFYATSTVLYKPTKTRVVLYLDTYGSYTISYTEPYGTTVTSGNTSNGNVYLEITYNKIGIRVVEVTNNINNEKIHIYLVGR